MSKIKGSRLLRKLIPGVMIGTDSDGNPTTFISNQSSWKIVDGGAVEWLVWRGYFDLAGISAEQLTTAVLGASLQEGDSFAMGNPTASGAVRVFDMLSKNRVLDSAFTDDKFLSVLTLNWCPPGFLQSNHDLEQILFGSYRRFTHDSTVTASTIKTDQTSWGAGSATAGDKIYITRAIPLTGNTAAGSILVPSAAYVLPVSYVNEKELVYLERLRRSYVLDEA